MREVANGDLMAAIGFPSGKPAVSLKSPDELRSVDKLFKKLMAVSILSRRRITSLRWSSTI